MNEKMDSRPSAASSTSQGGRKYVLEEVFWVPVSNCSDRDSDSAVPSQHRSDTRDTSEVSNPVETELDAAWKFR
jgi:hypothetical protein